MSAAPLRLATWNVNSIRKRAAQLEDWLAERRPDAVCLQETKVEDPLFPEGLFDACGYEVAYHGQKQYNGVAIASRRGLADVRCGMPGDDGQARVVAATVAGVRVLSLYVPNGSAAGTDKYEYKLRFYKELAKLLRAERAAWPVVCAGGDYNVAPADDDVYDIDDWGRGTICVTAAERDAFAATLAAGYVDAHRELDGAPYSHTWWDYRRGSYANNRGLRIDHFLVAGGRCARLEVDHGPRQQQEPSDHAPVVLELRC